MPPYQSRSEARAHLRKLRLQCSNQSQSESFEQKARLGVSPKQREARADQERLRRPPGGVRHVAGGWGKSTPSHQPGALGSFLGVKAKPLRGRCASLDPHPSDSAPQAPARASGAFFEWRAGQGVGAAPAAPQGRGHGPLTRPERPKPAGRVSGRSSPAPLPLGERPPAGSPKALMGVRCRGHPCPGVQGGAQPLGLRSEQNPLPKASISALRASLFGSSRPPEGGLNPRDRRGTPESHE